MTRTAKEYLVVGTLLALYVGGTALDILGERAENKRVNRDIFPAFRAIERQCSAEDTARCRKVREAMTECVTDPSYPCSAKEYYRALTEAGFSLPPLLRE
jgi:hypothetical protein